MRDCYACGIPFRPGSDDEGCQPCGLCISCTPAACICKEGARMRREDAAAADWKWFREVVGL